MFFKIVFLCALTISVQNVCCNVVGAGNNGLGCGNVRNSLNIDNNAFGGNIANAVANNNLFSRNIANNGFGGNIANNGIGGNIANANLFNIGNNNAANGLNLAGAAANGVSQIGYGEIVLNGDLPVGGNAAITGKLPVVGYVMFEGHLPANGLVSVTEPGCGHN